MSVSFQDMYKMTKASGDSAGQSAQNLSQNRTIEQILAEAQSSGDPNVMQQSIGKILSKVAPERQPMAIQYIQGLMENQKKKQQLDTLEKYGIDRNLPPDLAKLAFKEKLNEDRLKAFSEQGSYNDLTNDQLTTLLQDPTHKEPAKYVLKSRAEKKEKASVNKAKESFEKKIYENILSTLEEAPRAKQQLKNLDRMSDLIYPLQGLFGYGKALVGSENAAEFNGLGVAALEAPIHALFGKGVIAREKFNALKQAFVPTASESRYKQRGKINALRAFNNEALRKVNHIQGLYDKYGLDIPLDEVFKFNKESQDLVDKAIKYGEDFSEVLDIEKKNDQNIGDKDVKENLTNQSIKQPNPLALQQQDEFNREGQALALPIQAQPQQPTRLQQPWEPPESTKEPKAPPKSQESSGKGLYQAYLDFEKNKSDENIHNLAILGRAGSKALGSTADMVNWVQSIFSPYTYVDVEKLTKKHFGKEMSIEELAEKAYDYATNDNGKPRNVAEKYLETAAKTATEFVMPAGLLGKGAKAVLAGEGLLAGAALQGAKDMELGTLAEIGALFLPSAASFSKGLVRIAKNPEILSNMGKDFVKWVSEVQPKEKLKNILPKFKEKLKKGTAEYLVKDLGLEEKQLIQKGVDKVDKVVRQPLSEVFTNEKVNLMEANMSQHPEGANYYKPLFDEIGEENISKYRQVLTNRNRFEAKNLVDEFAEPKNRQNLKERFYDQLKEETKATKAEFRTDFKKLTSSRKVGDRISVKDTNRLIKSIYTSIEKLRAGGTISGDKKAIEYLETFKERLVSSDAKNVEQIKKLNLEIKQAQDRIKNINERFGKNVDITPGLREQRTKSTDLIIKNTKMLESLKNKGALVSEVEAGYRKINKALNREKAFDYKDISKLELRRLINDSLKNYGETNPKYYKKFIGLNERYSDASKTILSDMVYKFIHGEDPGLVRLWLNSPKNVEKFNNLISRSGEFLGLKEIGDTIKLAKAHEMILPKLFHEGKVRPTIQAFTAQEKDLLHALLGDARYKNFVRLSEEFGKESKKLDVYLNKSFSGVRVSIDAKKALKASGYWDLLKAASYVYTGKLGKATKNVISGAGKIGATKQDAILSALFTDTDFQKTLIDIVSDSRRAKPNYEAVERMVKILKEKGIAISDIIKNQE